MNAVFDPLGFITPIVLEAKLLYRNLCEKKLDWDESMPAEDLLRWQRWLENLMHLRMVPIPRWLGLYSSKDNQTCVLHYFADASQLAYGAVSYPRIVDYAGNTSCSLGMSKSYLLQKKRDFHTPFGAIGYRYSGENGLHAKKIIINAA